MNAIIALLSRFINPNVDTVLKAANAVVVKLEKVENAKLEQAARLNTEARKLQERADRTSEKAAESITEANRAVRVAARFKEILA